MGEVALIVTPGSSWLVRVNLAAGESPDVDSCRLVDVTDGTEHTPLPRANATQTLAFGVPAGKRAEEFALVLGERRLELPATTPRRFARSPAMDAELDALALRTKLARAQRQAAELEAELRRRDTAAAHARHTAERWQHRYREMRREAARLALHTKAADAPALGQPPPQRGRRRRTAVAMAATCALSAAIVGIVIGDGEDGAATPARAATPLAQAAVGDIPARWVRLYKRAGTRYGLDWAYLAAVGSVESDHGKQGGTSSAGASGPAQFLDDTWQRFGLDADGDARADPRDPADAVFAMAAYLRASGAPQDWSRALLTYNHSAAYAQQVTRKAAVYRRLLRGR